MAMVQALIALVGRSAGSILTTAFGWAVTALFGRVSSGDRLALSAVVGAAAAWPLVLVGLVFPRLVAFLVAFVPLSNRVPAGAVRVIWLALAVAIPLGVGISLHLKSPHGKQQLWQSALLGFRVTAGLALAFAFMLVSAPVLQLWSLAKGRKDEHVVAICAPEHYAEVADGLQAAWSQLGLPTQRVAAPFWLTFPTKVLAVVAGGGFERYVATDLAYFSAPDVVMSLYPSDLFIRGKPAAMSRAVTVALEALAGLPALQTTDVKTQAIERQIQHARGIPSAGLGPSAAPDAAAAGSRQAASPKSASGAVGLGASGAMAPGAGDAVAPIDVLALAHQLLESGAPSLDQRTVYRELLQLWRHSLGEQQLLEGRRKSAPSREPQQVSAG